MAEARGVRASHAHKETKRPLCELRDRERMTVHVEVTSNSEFRGVILVIR